MVKDYNFSSKSGTRQWCSLWPLLLSIVLDILIQGNKARKIKVIQTGNKSLTVFTDDMFNNIEKQTENSPELLKLLSSF